MPSQTTVIHMPRRPGRPRKDAQLPVLGHVGRTPLSIDLARLLRSRLFVQAAPGGGKSYALRRMLEQTHTLIQQIVIDPEGELVTLADKFDYLVLAADSEETPLRAETAGELAKHLWTSGHSAILCLEAMEVEEMQRFVGEFLRGLMAVRKEHWHPLSVVVDEAQLFAPQQDKAESKKAMIDLAARGRKRGICPIVATQRISQIHKGVVAHLQNHLIGLTTLDIDIERASELLGIKPARAGEILRKLETGEFLTFGPALGHEVVTLKVGPVQTQHGALDRFTDKLRRKRPISKRKVLKTIKQLGTEQDEDGRGQGGDAEPAREDARHKLAEFRRWVILPLLAKEAEHGAIAERCRDLDLTQMEVGTWLTAFRKRYALEDLRPQRVRDAMVQDMVRLSTRMLQDAAHHGRADQQMTACLRRVA